MRFRPCIDLREGRVVQIIGSSLVDKNSETLKTNFETDRSPEEFAKMYKEDNLTGGHVISLGSGNEEAALSALQTFPGGFHIGGGITPQNAITYLDAGASHVIVTSYVFSNGRIDMEKLKLLQETVGKNRLVLDLSCRKKGPDFWIVTDRWQKFTNEIINPEILSQLADHCDEFLVHGVDVEGKMEGIQTELIGILGKYSPIPVTYAGGVKALSDLNLVKEVGSNRVDLTIGSALDIFGGTVPYRSVVEWFQN
ncbi:MAG: phosphoribosylformimino-5-aminoimidazole carboxamide ribotide isomerase [Candidatus Scalindua sp.]|nr:phosphoribosylformimino-5-aminoimidazole carboxamide ribotide isomerase [Candidatus Scalindua sp.]